MADTIHVPARWGLRGERVDTPLADALTQRLEPVAASLEASGRIGSVRRLARVVRSVKRAEVTLAAGSGAADDATLRKAQEIVRGARRVLGRANLLDALCEGGALPG